MPYGALHSRKYRSLPCMCYMYVASCWKSNGIQVSSIYNRGRNSRPFQAAWPSWPRETIDYRDWCCQSKDAETEDSEREKLRKKIIEILWNINEICRICSGEVVDFALILLNWGATMGDADAWANARDALLASILTAIPAQGSVQGISTKC